MAVSLAEGPREIARHLLPARRRRSNPRVVKRKMSNFGVKRLDHRNWPRPTRDPAEAVTIAPHYKTAPINPPVNVPRAWDHDPD
ncbi:hypothetical protein ACWGJX_42900 [Streptomyces sp. NPDC054775]